MKREGEKKRKREEEKKRRGEGGKVEGRVTWLAADLHERRERELADAPSARLREERREKSGEKRGGKRREEKRRETEKRKVEEVQVTCLASIVRWCSAVALSGVSTDTASSASPKGRRGEK